METTKTFECGTWGRVTKEELWNQQVMVEYRIEDKQIFARDLTDKENESVMITCGNDRGIKGAWKEVTRIWNENTNIKDLALMFKNRNIRTHAWYMTDAE